MFCTDGANVGPLKLEVKRIVEHLQCVWISENPNNLDIMVAKGTSRPPNCDRHLRLKLLLSSLLLIRTYVFQTINIK